MLRLIPAFAAVALLASAPTIAAPCKDAKGKFIKCPPPKPIASTRCKGTNGKFAKCGTPGAKPV